MKPIPDHYFKAFYARDQRYDGVFFTGVTSTGVYCRPVCKARKPKPQNCVFFNSAAEAEQAHFRPCLLCRPELAPGTDPEINTPTQTLSERQQRRHALNAMGVTPKQWQRTEQLLLAKQLLTDSQLSVTEIAFASGFNSVRRFNTVFKNHYQMNPTRLRKSTQKTLANSDWIRLQIGYRAPYQWQPLLDFLRARAVSGVEYITDKTFSRCLYIGQTTGEIRVSNQAKKNRLLLDISPGLIPHLQQVLRATQAVFDTNARPDLIMENLIAGDIPGDFRSHGYGLRVPGSYDGFELAVRAILGQQITVKAATTLSRRFCERFCLPYAGLQPELTRLPVAAATIARASVEDIASLGIIARRAQAIITIAQLIENGQLILRPKADAENVLAQLQAIPGIGPWTANYIALRALAWPDAFPKEDIVLRKALNGATAKQADQRSQAWRPWRSYACLYLWSIANE